MRPVGEFGEYGSGGHVSLNDRWFSHMLTCGVVGPPRFHTSSTCGL